MTIIFVGDKPSKKNINPNIAFVGTKSYKTLLGWIADMDINIADVLLTNNISIETNTWLNNDSWCIIDNNIVFKLIPNITRFIALGKNAEQKLKKLNLAYFSLAHPSGLNRKINDKQWLNSQLKACKLWLS